MRPQAIATLLSLALAAPASGGEADVVDVKFTNSGNGTYNFSVTVKHADEGWDHFANNWEIVTSDGTVLATRVLAHPHVEEQPFTRSKSGINIPEGITEVIVRTHDSVHGHGGKEMRVKLN